MLVLPAAPGAGSRARPVALCIVGALFGRATDFHAEDEGSGIASRCRRGGRHGAADAGLLCQDRLACHLGATPGAVCGINGDLSRSAGEDDVRHRNLFEDAIGGLPGTAVHRLSGCDGRAGADERAQLCCGLLRGDFAELGDGDQTAADSAHLSALSSGSTGAEKRRFVQAA